MKVLLCGGGSVGHISPAIAIAEAIKQKDKNAEFLFVSREGGSENDVIKKAGINLKTIKVEGIQRKLTAKNFERISLALKAIDKAAEILTQFSPDAVIITGGYVSWPVAKAALKLKIPLILHESNAYPGLVTRIIASKCDLVLLSNEEAKKYIRKSAKAVVVGNPITSDFYKYTRTKARKLLNLGENDILLVSFGGSIGAEKINSTVISIMESYSVNTRNFHHIHATGKKHFDKIDKRDLKKGKNGCKILPYIDNMATMLWAADIVICRSGAMTLSELSAVGVASILIPSEHVTNNHQYKNAKMLYDRSACLLIEEKDLSEESLVTNLSLLINDREARNTLSQKIKKLSQKDASRLCADSIIELLRKNTSALH